jgi:hypothetical protein
MRRNPIRDLCAIALAFSAAFTLGCGQPFTDIVANDTSQVGAWDIENAHVDGRQLTADVCMAHPDSAEAVSDRALFQLRNKGYDHIQLTMYAPADGQVQKRQVTWSANGGKQMQEGSQSSEDPCAAAQHAAAEHEATQHDAAPPESGR